MATRNGAAHLDAQLASLARQTYRDWRLFVSDDGSTDATLEILHRFGQEFPVRVEAGPRKGTAAANFMAALCHPDLPPGPVALADQDDVWLKGKLARAMRRLGQVPEPGEPALYAAESQLTDDGLRPLRRSRPGARARPGFGNALCQNLFGGHTTVMNGPALALIRQAGVPPGIAFHDWWIYQLMAGAGGQLCLDPLPMALYRQHSDNSLGGAGDAKGAVRRLGMALSGQWGGQMRAQALALQRVAALLTPQARAALTAYLEAPAAGPGRIAAFRRAKMQRDRPRATALMLAAAFLGRL